MTTGLLRGIASVNEAPRYASPLTVIDVADYAGGDLGSQLINALAAAPAAGAVLDCRRLTGAQAIPATIAVSKKVCVLFGESQIAVAAAIGIDVAPGASGSMFVGSGFTSLFTSVGGNTIFRVYGTGAGTDAPPTGDSYGVLISDLEISFSAHNAANIGVLLDHTILFRLSMLRVTNPSAGAHLGVGISGLAALTGVVDQCELRHFDKGAHWRKHTTTTSNCNAVKMTNSCNIFHNNTGAEWDDFTSAFLVNCVLEQNDIGLKINAGNEFFSFGNHYENDFGPTQPVGSGVNVSITAGNSPNFIGDEFNIAGGSNGRDIQYAGTNNVKMIACKTTAGVTVTGGGRVEKVNCFVGGTDVTTLGQVITQDSVSTSRHWRVGTAVDATDAGDLSAGLVGAQRLFYDQSDASLGLYTIGGTRAVYIQAATGATLQIGLINGVNSGVRLAAEVSGYEYLQAGHNASDPGSQLRICRMSSASPLSILEIISDNYYINDIAGTIENQIATRAAQSTVLNEQGRDIDLRAEGDNKPSNLLLDASEDEVSVDGRFSLRALTPAQLVADANNYDPEATPANRASFWRLSSDALRNITGIAGGLNGRTLVLVNVGANAIVLQNQNAGSADANKIITGTGADITLAADDQATLIYDATTLRWRVLA